MSFNVRIYGILINQNNEVLLSDERYSGQQFTKFPGGGLEFGEGAKDCLIREFKEELNIEITVGEVFYVTDFFVASAFNKDQQIISIYYKVYTEEWGKIKTSKILFDFKTDASKQETRRWKKLSELTEDDVTFPIDKVVAKMLGEGNC